MKPEFNLIAIEPSTEMAGICRDKHMQVLNSFVENISGYNNSFDALTAFELFEHLYDPVLFIQKVRALLKPGGVFIFTTLNGLGFDIQLLWGKSKSVSPPHHLNFFNPFSIRTLLTQNGFAVSEISTPGQLDWNIIEGGWIEENIDPGRFWKTFSKYGNKEAKEALQQWIKHYNFSSHMRIIATKQGEVKKIKYVL